MQQQKKKDIFVSYKNDGSGNNFATRLVGTLRESGYSVYFNPDEAKSGNFPQRLRLAIENCKDFICIVTSDYLTSLYSDEQICWVRDELLCAKKHSKNIIPILINGVQMPTQLDFRREELRFFADIDAYIFPEQYISSPYSVLCNVLTSRADGSNGYRDVYNSNPDFNPDRVLNAVLIDARAGNIEAMYQAGIYYFYGIAQEQNYKEAAKWFMKVANSESKLAPMANKFIGRLYYQGSMPREPQSYKKSFEYHQKAAQEDNFSARHIAHMMARGSGCEFDYEKAVQYYISIVARSDSIGKMGLGELYSRYGEFSKAAAIYEEIADSYPAAAYELGLLYRSGVLSRPAYPDYHTAAMYFQSAAEKGHTRAAYELAELYFNPTGKFKCDFEKAEHYFRVAAAGGIDKANYVLGYMYEYGHVNKDIEKAIFHYEQAYSRGDVLSANHLAVLYQQPGHHNFERAFTCCKYAANGGDAPSEFMLGIMYLCGRGCEADPDKAYMWLKRASEHGAPEALEIMKQMEAMDL